MTVKQHVLDQSDGGISSRKLWMSVLSTVLVAALGCLAAGWPAFAGQYQTAIGGIVACLGLYVGANVSNSWLTGKNIVQHAAVTAAAAPDEVAEPQAPAQEDEHETC